MSERGLSGFDVNTGLGSGSGGAPIQGGEPFRLLLVADFSGRGSRGEVGDLKARKARRVDRDDLDQELARLEARLELRTHAAAEPIELQPRSLDDLHPDELWSELGIFEELRSLRRRLSNPATYEAARAELGGAPTRPAAPAPGPSSEAPALDLDELRQGGLLDAAIEETSQGQGTASSLVDAVLRDLVIPKLPDSAEQAQLVGSIDAAAADEMRAILSNPSFRRLEAAWRSAQLLVRRLETDARLQVWMFDASLEELVRDVATHEDPRATDLWRALFEPDATGAPRWAAWAPLDLAIGAPPNQIALLDRFARLAQAARAPVVVAGRSDLCGSSSWARADHPSDWDAVADETASAWRALRQEPEAAWALVATPRLLMRAPYGRRSSPLERFDFEELPTGDRDALCWGSGAIVPLVVLGRTFAAEGWQLELRQRAELDGLPLAIVPDEDGEATAVPCAEAVLTERALEALSALGLTPLISLRDSDRVRLETLRGLGGELLAGRWADA